MFISTGSSIFFFLAIKKNKIMDLFLLLIKFVVLLQELPTASEIGKQIIQKRKARKICHK